MEYLFYFFTFIFGAIIGSFLNVVIYRYNTGMTLMGRSFCFSCNKPLSWAELFPVLSYVALGGKCNSCKSKISKQYTIVEVVMGLISLLIFWKLGGVNAFLNHVVDGKLNIEWVLNIFLLYVIFGLLVAISVYDFKHKIIPDFWVYTFSAVSLLRMIFLPDSFNFSLNIWDFLAGPLLALPFAALWYFSGGRWMGFGDAKLALGIGWFLGITSGISAVVFAFWIGAIFGITILFLSKISETSLFRRKISMKSELPFAPFLIFGTFLVFFIPAAVKLVCVGFI